MRFGLPWPVPHRLAAPSCSAPPVPRRHAESGRSARLRVGSNSPLSNDRGPTMIVGMVDPRARGRRGGQRDAAAEPACCDQATDRRAHVPPCSANGVLLSAAAGVRDQPPEVGNPPAEQPGGPPPEEIWSPSSSTVGARILESGLVWSAASIVPAGVRARAYTRLTRPSARPDMPPDAREWLTEQYVDEARGLAALTGKNPRGAGRRRRTGPSRHDPVDPARRRLPLDVPVGPHVDPRTRFAVQTGRVR